MLLLGQVSRTLSDLIGCLNVSLWIDFTFIWNEAYYAILKVTGGHLLLSHFPSEHNFLAFSTLCQILFLIHYLLNTMVIFFALFSHLSCKKPPKRPQDGSTKQPSPMPGEIEPECLA